MYYFQFRPNSDLWSNSDSSPTSINQYDAPACQFHAPADGTLTNITAMGYVNDTGATDPFKFYFYKSAMSSDTTAVSLTAMFNTSAITPPTANRTWTHTEDFSSSNTFAEDDMLFVYLKKDSTSGNQDLFWNMNINGEYS